MAQTSTLPPIATASRLQELFTKQRQASERVKMTTARERISKLANLRREVESNLPAIQEALGADFGKHPEEVTLTEVVPLLAEISHIQQHLRAWMEPQVVPTSAAFAGAACQVRYQARGVVLIISPWNYPFQLVFGPLATAIAAGNCAVVKPSEFCPHTAQLAAEMASRLFPEDEVAVVQGAKDTAQQLLELPFDHIFFTGSPAVGRKVMAAAARNLTSVTLELGGKSPVIIDRSARLQHAAARIAWGKWINAGQTCVAPDYILAPRDLQSPFVAHLKTAVGRLYGGPAAALTNPDYCRLIHQQHLQRLESMLERAVQEGARIEFGGQVDRTARKLAPTVLTQVSRDNPIMEEEIFGPILPILSYESLSEAIRLVNSLPHPLALYAFSRERKVTERILAETVSGDSVVNDVVVHFSNSALPFGGVGSSGIGKAHGIYGFQEFSHLRGVLQQSRFSPTSWLTPPYSRPWLRRLVKWTLRYFV